MSLDNNSTIDNGKKTKKPASERQIQASRANGAKSKGPVTPEGKARSSQNARKHGCLAAIVTFTPEDEKAFNQIHHLYIERFEPAIKSSTTWSNKSSTAITRCARPGLSKPP